MPYKDGYDNGYAVFDRIKGFVKKPVQVKGEISLKTIDPKFIERYSIQVGDITPWTKFKVIE